MNLNLERVAEDVVRGHTIEEILVEHRRVAGAPSINIRCTCGQVCSFLDFAEHVAKKAIEAAERELVEEGVL